MHNILVSINRHFINYIIYLQSIHIFIVLIFFVDETFVVEFRYHYIFDGDQEFLRVSLLVFDRYLI